MHTEFLHVCPRVGGQAGERELTHGSVHFLTFSYLIPVTLTQMLRFKPDQSVSRRNKIVFCGDPLFFLSFIQISLIFLSTKDGHVFLRSYSYS